MATAAKHRQRSHYSYHNNSQAVFTHFELRSAQQKTHKEQKSFIQRFLATSRKGDR